jgi:multiple sugar transport system ATP-binding protein
MANIKLEKLTRSFGKQVAVQDLSLEIGENEFIALLGPSGCGKTTTMNMISGLLKPDSGQVYFDGKLMNDVPPGSRGVGFVFQNYAVFTHMTAYDNIACGLRVQNVPKEEIERTVGDFASLLKIDHILHLSAGKLSINDMQKVALARTMVTKPSIMLLDEPLSNLDAALRNVMRAELKRIHIELGQTTVYVTHDQVEAMSLADRIAVMNFAVLQQYDTPEEVYLRPKNLFVAKFIGSPTINFFKGSYRGNEIILKEFQKGMIRVSGAHGNKLKEKLKHKNVVVGLRPEHVKLKERDKNRLKGIEAQIVGIEPLGSETIVYLKPKVGEDLIVKSMMESDFSANINDTKMLSFNEDDIYVFDEETTQLVLKF